MVFIDPKPDPNGPSIDPEARYVADQPFDHKQTVLTARRHRWFQWITLGTMTGAYTKSLGVNAGATMRVQFDHKPDFIVVSISGQTAATGRCNVYPGDPGGDPIGPCGPGAKVVMPAPSGGIVSIVNIGSTPTFGVVLAVAGYTDPGVDINLGS